MRLGHTEQARPIPILYWIEWPAIYTNVDSLAILLPDNESGTLNKIMRKIEALMNDAISASTDMKLGNTKVITIVDTSFVYLHDNLIAMVTDDAVEVYDGGWQTTTTKSRLNAILKEHAIQGECIVQKNFKWYIHKFVGQAGSTPVFNEQEFVNGFIFA